MSDNEIIKILELAEKGELPNRISNKDKDNPPTVQIEILKELCEIGFLDSIDMTSNDGIEYSGLKINIAGREYLKKLKAQQFNASPQGLLQKFGIRLLDWTGGIIVGLIIAWVSSKFFK